MFGAFRAATKVAPTFGGGLVKQASQAQRLGQRVLNGANQAQRLGQQVRYGIQNSYGPYNRNRCNCNRNRRPNNVLAQGTSYPPRPPNGAGRPPNSAGRPPNGAGRPPNGRRYVNKTRGWRTMIPYNPINKAYQAAFGTMGFLG